MSWSASKAIAWGKKQLGSKAYAGKCQAFVADCCYNGGQKPRMSMSTATDARKAWMVSASKNNIPVGAALYFKGSNVKVGHAALYIGNGEYLNPVPSGVKITKLSNGIGYLGWGWNGNEAPSEGAVTDSGDFGNFADDTATSTKVEISTVNNAGYTGIAGVHKGTANQIVTGSQGLEIIIQNEKLYVPCVEDEVKLEQNENSPSTLTFTALKDEILNFQEGNPVAVRYGGEGAFYGYVFSKSRKDDLQINVRAYDQMRYLKAKDTFSYTEKTTGEFLNVIADDYGLVIGQCDDTGEKLSRIEETTVLDMIGNSLDDTLLNTGKKYVVYDDFGSLRVRSVLNMMTDYLLDEDTAGSYEYDTTIDEDVYTAFRFAWDDSSTGVRYKVMHHTEEPERKWGRLVYYENMNVDSNSLALNKEYVVAKATALAKYYTKKGRKLRVKDAKGSVKVRPGVFIYVMLDVGDIVINNYMYVKSCTHKWENGSYTMDMELMGFNAQDIKSDVTAGISKLADLIPDITVTSGDSVVSAGTTEATVFGFLKNNMGLSAAAACGVMGNIEAESEFKVDVGSRSSGYGLIQWTGTRFDKLKSWCDHNGKSYSTINGQLAYLKYEMTTKVPGLSDYTKPFNKIKALGNTSKDVETSCSIWCWEIEAPNKSLAHYDRRLNSAKGYFKTFGG